MADEKKIVASVAEKFGATALPYHKADAPFKSSALRNGAFKALQDAGVEGLTLSEWKAAAEALGSTLGAVKFILRAGRRVATAKLANGKYVVVGPLADGGELKFGKSGMPLKPKAKKVKAEKVEEVEEVLEVVVEA